MVSTLWKLILTEDTHFKNYLAWWISFLVINLLISTESPSCMSVILEAMEIAAILKYKKKGKKKFHSNVLILGTEKTSFKSNLALDNSCDLRNPCIMNYPHVYVISLQSDSKQLHRKQWESLFNLPWISRPMPGIQSVFKSHCCQSHADVLILQKSYLHDTSLHLIRDTRTHILNTFPSLLRSLSDRLVLVSGGCKDNSQNSQKPLLQGRSTGLGPGCATTSGGTLKQLM